MSRSVRPGDRGLLLDDVATWKSVGTAWYLAERGHTVTVVTRYPVVGQEMARTAGDIPIRERLKRRGAVFHTEAAVGAWHGDGATIVDLLSGEEQSLPFDSLVLATANVPCNELETGLREHGVAVHAIGDCVAARQAPAATYEGRRAGLSIEQLIVKKPRSARFGVENTL